LGALLQQAEAELGKPLIGTGGAERLWAGLVSGFVPDNLPGIFPGSPLLPQVAWTSIRPSSRMFGVGDLMTFSLPGETEDHRPVWVDRSLAYQLAYGATGIHPSVGIPEVKAQRVGRLIDILQEAISGRKAERFAYSDGTSLLSATQAMQAGTLSRNHLYIRLEDQTEIWINGSTRFSWDVRVEEREWRLPPFGFILRGPDSFVVHQPSANGLENTLVVRTPDFRWVSSPNEEVTHSGITLRGCIQLKRTGPGERILEIMDWSGSASISREVMSLQTVGTIRATDPEGNPVTDVRMMLEGDRWVLRSETPLKNVWIFERIQGEDRNFSP
jgi:hypothetical protein